MNLISFRRAGAASSLLLAMSAVCAANTFTVTNTADSGAGSLRQAFTSANSNPGLDNIVFNIGGGGVQTINLSTNVFASSPVNLDGTTQPGYSGSPLIEIVNGCNIQTGSAGSTVKGIAFLGPVNNALAITTSNVEVLSCYFGIRADGVTAQAVSNGCIVFNGSNSVIGRPGQGNYFAATTNVALNIAGGSGIRVMGNSFGVNVPGTARLGGSLPFAISLNANNSIVGGTNPGEGNLISGYSTGISVGGSTGMQILGNVIGPKPSGLGGYFSGSSFITGSAIQVLNAGTDVTIGAPGAGNVIGGAGVGINLSGGCHAVIQGNYIGFDNDKTSFLKVNNAILGNNNVTAQIGGGSPGQGNVMASANGDRVVRFVLCSNSSIQGNLIGTNATGLAGSPSTTGISLESCSLFTIGGPLPGQGNVISGCSTAGIDFLNTNQCTIQGNYIGTDVNGVNAIPNKIGITLGQSNQNLIGGPVASAGNVISGNSRSGIEIQLGTNGSNNNTVQRNLIGMNVNGAPLGNQGVGVSLIWGTGNVITQNSIAFNVPNPSSPSIFKGLGIDIAPSNGQNPDGVTPNDPGDADTGPNNKQNYPVITSVVSTGSAVTISGTLNSTPNSTFTIEFFANSAIDPTNFGEGEKYIGSATVTTDAGGNAAFQTPVAYVLPAGWRITSTATDSSGNTSEFSGFVTPVANRAPVADAGADQTVTVPHDHDPATNVANFTLSGNASSDPDGDTLAYEWSLGGSVVGTSAQLSQSKAPGSYSYTLSVSDGKGLSSTDTVTVTVSAEPNAAPVAVAGDDQSVTVQHDGDADTNTATFTISGSSSSDPDSDVLSFTWKEGASTVGSNSSLTLSRTPGTYTFELVVTDSYGSSSSDTVVVTVNAEPNAAPTANAGADQTVSVPHDGDPNSNTVSVSLHGSGADSDGDGLTYKWTFQGQPAGSTAELNADLTPGDYDYTLTVTDAYGAEASSTVHVHVDPEPNQPPQPGASDTSATVPHDGDPMTNTAEVVLEGSGTDPDGDAVTLEWIKDGTVIGTSSTVTLTLAPGDYFVTLKVTDSYGESRQFVMVVQVIGEENHAPFVEVDADHSLTISHDGDPNTNTASDTLTAQATDPEADPLTYQWKDENGNLLGSSLSVSVQLTPGDHAITFTATDPYGASRSGTVNVHVNEESNGTPTVGAIAPISTTVAHDGNPNTNTVDVVVSVGSVSDPDNDSLTYKWTNENGDVVSSSSSFTSTMTPGSHHLNVQVSDPYGASDSQGVDVTVSPEPNGSPVAIIGPDFTVKTQPGQTTATFELDGSSSTDPDDDSLGYQWTLQGQPAGSTSHLTVTQPVGVYTYTLTVTDAYGASSSKTVTVTVEQGNQTPVANGGPNKTVTVPHDGNATTKTASVSLDGSASSDPDGQSLSYEWRDQNGSVVGTAATLSRSLEQGSYSYTLKVTDPFGASANSTVLVQVLPEPNQAPTVTTGGAQTTAAGATGNATVTVNATAGDPDGDGVTVTWYEGSTLLASGSTLTATLPAGSHILTAVATDPYGLTASATATVGVQYTGTFFLQPINNDNSSIFKQGSTVPVKFQLTGASAGATAVVARIYIAKVTNSIIGTEMEPISTSAADTGNLFRYSGGIYIFNLNTKGLTAGTYQVRADLGDGNLTHTVLISLKP